MKLAFCSISALDRSVEEAARLAAAAGLDGLEVTARPPHLNPEAGAPAARPLGEAVRAAGVEVTAYGSYLGHPGRASPEAARGEVAIAAALGSPLLRVWAERIESDGDDPRRVVEWIRAACDAAAELGVTVVVERHIGSLADTPENVEALLAAVGRDNFALNYQVLDFLPADQVDAQPADAARLVRHARYFHLKNYRPNPDDPSGRLVPGGSLEGGVLDYPAILRAALAAGYRGPLGFEFLSWEPKPVEEKLAADVAFVRRELAAIRAEEAAGCGGGVR
jgi:sugar phosphate isomerase/epimerase